MKHVFFITNNTIFLTAINVIKYENLDKRDCIFLYRTGTKTFEQENFNDIKNMFFKDIDFKIKPNPILTWINLLYFYVKICFITGFKPFYFYLAHSYSISRRLMIKHFLCRGYSYLEEGLLTYRETDFVGYYKSRYMKYMVAYNYFNLISTQRIAFQEEYTKAYALSPKSFPTLTRDKVVLKNLFTSLDDTTFDGATIITVSRCSEIGITSLESELNAIKLILGKFKAKKNLFIKYHPRQEPNKIKKIRVIIADVQPEYGIEELPFTTSIENILHKNKNVTLVSDISSLALYAINAGHTVISYFNLMVDAATAEEYLTAFPRYYREKIKNFNDGI